MVNGYLGEPAFVTDSLQAAFTSVIKSAVPDAAGNPNGE
jgi:hypothetical protein